MPSLRDSIACVTGASSGIGKACAYALGAEGAHLLLCARRKDHLDAIAADLSSTHRVRALPLELDVRDKEAVLRCFETLPAEWRAIDLLVNNAGLGRGLEKLHTGSPDDWDEMIDTNVKGLLYVSRAVIPAIREIYGFQQFQRSGGPFGCPDSHFAHG